MQLKKRGRKSGCLLESHIREPGIQVPAEKLEPEHQDKWDKDKRELSLVDSGRIRQAGHSGWLPAEMEVEVLQIAPSGVTCGSAPSTD